MMTAGHSVAVETHAGSGIGGRTTILRTALRTILDFARKVFASREMIEGLKSPAFRMASLQENRTVLNCIPYTFPQRDFHCWPNYQEEDPQRARICKHSMCGFGPIGEIMAAGLYRADAQPEVTGSVA